MNRALLYGGLNYDKKKVDEINNVNTSQDSNLMQSDFVFSHDFYDFTARGSSWTYLPGTKSEIIEINSILNTKKFKSQMIMDDLGTEESFKLQIMEKSPRVIHLATHGFFFPDPRNHDRQVPAGSQLDIVFKMSDQPMLRSGLIMAGGNTTWNGEGNLVGNEDGILTAYEISQMDLSNTELVVLSACETGLGDIQGNEGVYGLQRAFKIAGAKYLIMSLWQVPDKQTSMLMISFYKKWLEEKLTIPDAFHAAQKELRDLGFDPYQWAGFVLVE